MTQLCFSPLGVDPKLIEKSITRLKPYINRIHWDFMDKTFVPYVGLPLNDLKASYLNDISIDVHLMVNNPYQYLEIIAEMSEFNDIQFVIGQIEVLDDPREFINKCHEFGFKAALAISPDTGIDTVEPFINDTDGFLILGVMPGKSGQSLMPQALDTL